MLFKQDSKDTEEEKKIIDNHYSPIIAEEYIRFRLYPELDFYQSRLPR